MMTPLEWFAFVILPATLAVVAIGLSRLFDAFHPIPGEATGSSSPTAGGFESANVTPQAGRPRGAERKPEAAAVKQSTKEATTIATVSVTRSKTRAIFSALAGEIDATAARIRDDQSGVSVAPDPVPVPSLTPQAAKLPNDAAESTVFRSGVMDGMAYTLYMDGSIEAELPQGNLKFGSVDKLQQYLATKS